MVNVESEFPRLRFGLVLLIIASSLSAGETENDYYRITTLPIPKNLQLEVSGIAAMPDGRIAVCVRRGEVWLIENAGGASDKVRYKRFASGLHEPLGLTWHKGALYTVQRSEVTKLIDRDGNDEADQYTTAARGWGVSGNYHEYAYGPVFDPKGNMYVTLNATIGNAVTTDRNWRGWSLRFTPNGTMQPVSAGMRSPIGIATNHAGDVFGADHQGNWFPTCPLYHIRDGVFHGHADALKFCDLPGASFEHPGKIKTGMTVGEAAQAIKPYVLPAVWFPYRKMGTGSTGIVCDTTAGRFGPFENQLFVGDFSTAMISRVFLEKVGGEYQGACFPFREGFDCGVVSLAFGRDGSMFVGETNRGWNSVGSRSFGLQRLEWSGQTPFEVKAMRARPDGFEIEFTHSVDRTSASASRSYSMSSYTYPYHSRYGGDEINIRKLNVIKATIAADRRHVHLNVEGLRASFVHELHLSGVRSSTGGNLLHDRAYYTLNRIPAR